MVSGPVGITMIAPSIFIHGVLSPIGFVPLIMVIRPVPEPILFISSVWLRYLNVIVTLWRNCVNASMRRFKNVGNNHRGCKWVRRRFSGAALGGELNGAICQ